ncbi:bifunctional glycosyltransferase family 2/GtrA family protein [Granulicella sp. dw_53]|uniref:bifunctional glycosyltransferase family 2/GtrA family protein n=1 Tax=Granulicella sp. dw_53 TaxID=2719792 RepID=UPI001BD428A9|nr:bifunctional glycosyltransferase family 2/GtrA family protein [Granulicella sp. dw_53]
MSLVDSNPPCDLTRLAILIPARQPDLTLLSLVSALVDYGFASILIVDDSGSTEYQPLFEQLSGIASVQVLHHAVNLGKGRALKTGINHLLVQLPKCNWLVTADADGQHRAEDIRHVAQATKKSVDRMVLGVRTFGEDVPLRSRFGNVLTRNIFQFITGTKLVDTQTGLRGFSRSMLPELMILEGERYEYEMTVLVHLCRLRGKPLEVPIQTIYLDGNKSSHFNPFWDSMRIYFMLVRFYFSSLIAAGVDFAGFSATFAITHNLPISVAVGRLSSLVNFAVNRRFVFQSRGSIQGMLLRYYALVAAIAALSYLLIWLLTTYLRWNVYAAKVAVDILLSLVSFSVQRTFVFRRPPELS